MVKNKRGWLRIVEVFIAIMVIIGSVLIVLQTKKAEREQSFCQLLPDMMDDVVKNESLRSYILQGQNTQVESYLGNRMKNPSFVFRAVICNPEDLCLFPSSGGLDNVDICAEQRIVSTSQDSSIYNPKKLKVYMFKV